MSNITQSITETPTKGKNSYQNFNKIAKGQFSRLKSY